MNGYPVGPSRKKRARAFGLVELLVMIGVVVVLAWVMMPRMKTGNRASATRIKCVNNLRKVGLAFRIFATDNNDLFPTQKMMSNGVALAEFDAVRVFRALSNEIADPRILISPADERIAAASFTNLTARNISYFASLSAKATSPQVSLAGDRNVATNGVAIGTGLFALTTNSMVSWTKELHVEQGDILMSDGSVQQMSSSLLKQWLRDQDMGTNYLVFP